MNGQILSISSHVVHGYVGNRAITFPLQYLGWNVDALNTVNLSNHPGYGRFGGKTEDPALIQKVLKGLEDIDNSIGHYDMVLTGYLPNDEIIESVKDAIYKNFSSGKRPILIMDPILGDNGKIYVKESIIPVYKQLLNSGYVDLITPNQFEFEVLTGKTITDLDSLKEAIRTFVSQYKVDNIVLSSINIGNDMYSVGYTKKSKKAMLVPIDEIPCKFFGCGDLFTGLISHGFYKHQAVNEEVLKDCVTKLTLILQRTLDLERLRLNKDIKVVNDLSIVSSASILLQDFSQKQLDVIYLDIE